MPVEREREITRARWATENQIRQTRRSEGDAETLQKVFIVAEWGSTGATCGLGDVSELRSESSPTLLKYLWLEVIKTSLQADINGKKYGHMYPP